MKKLFTLIAAGFLMVACSEDVTTSRSDGDKQNITFSVTYDDAISVQIQNASTRAVAPWTLKQISQPATMAQVVAVETDFPSEEPLCLTIIEEPFIRRADSSDVTRGALLNSGDADDLSFGVTEYPTGGTNIANAKWENSHPSYEGNISAGEELFKAIQKWESDAYTGTQYDFYAYAPWEDAGTGQGITLSENRQTITYDPTGVPANNQPDLMTARKATSAYVSAVPLTFHHRLCAVQIKTASAWDTDYEVSGVQFQNIYYYGTFDIDSDKEADWKSYNGGTSENPGPKGNYTATGFETGVAAVNAVVAGETSTWLMMIPQSLSGAKLSVTLRHKTSGKTYTMTAPINNSIWHAGYTVTYMVGPEQITSMYVSYPLGNRAWSGSENGLVTEYAANEEFGLFVVDKDGNVIVSNATAKASADGAEPTLTLPTGVFFSKQYKYFLMYPKKTNEQLSDILNNATNWNKLNGTSKNTGATADMFFSDLIAAWTPVADQHELVTLHAQDLQVSMFDGTKFPMEHQMGFVNIKMGGASASTSAETRTLSGNTTNTSYSSTTTDNAFYALDNFVTNLPYKVGTPRTADLNCYFIVNPAHSYTFSTSYKYGDANTFKQWDDIIVNSSVISRGNYREITTSAPKFKNIGRLYSYTGGCQEYSPFYADCKYQMECWGASGGKLYNDYEAMSAGGRGGYTSGIITLTASNISTYPKFYVYVGQRGDDWYSSTHQHCSAAWNGGGAAYNACGGGGATDIRLEKAHASDNTVWNGNLDSRIMVAGAGGGANDYGFGGAGGGLTGLVGIQSDASAGVAETSATGGTQSAGGTGYASGGFGYGGGDPNRDGGAGGGGYYGGGQSAIESYGTGGGGSSYISGLAGCTNHSSGLLFSSAVTHSGTVAVYSPGGPTGANTTIPDPQQPQGNSLAYTKYSVDGYARITFKPYD